MSNLTKLIICLVVGIIAIILLNIFFVKRYRAYKIGALGEKHVKKLLDRNLSGKRYVYNNLMFKFNGNVSQIDHVVINKYGIFVIETKHWSGTVFGKDDDQVWTLVKRGGKKKKVMGNPVTQNEIHVRKLAEILMVDRFYFRNMVVFLKNTNTQFINSSYVYKTNTFLNYLKTDKKYFSGRDLKDFDDRLKAYLSEHGISQKEFNKHYR